MPSADQSRGHGARTVDTHSRQAEGVCSGIPHRPEHLGCGYRAGYSAQTASHAGSKLIGLPNVVHEAQEERSKRTKVDKDFVIEQLYAVANSNIGDFLEWRGALRDSRIRKTSPAS